MASKQFIFIAILLIATLALTQICDATSKETAGAIHHLLNVVEFLLLSFTSLI